MSKNEALGAQQNGEVHDILSRVTEASTTIGPRKLTMVQGGRVARLLEELSKGDELKGKSVPQVADMLGKALGFPVPVNTVRTIAEELGVTVGEPRGARGTVDSGVTQTQLALLRDEFLQCIDNSRGWMSQQLRELQSAWEMDGIAVATKDRETLDETTKTVVQLVKDITEIRLNVEKIERDWAKVTELDTRIRALEGLAEEAVKRRAATSPPPAKPKNK